MEHQDKHRVFFQSPQADVPPEFDFGLTKQEKEKKDLEKIKIRQAEVFEDKKAELKRQYADFLVNTETQEQIERHGVDWGDPGFIIEIFVADYSAGSKLLVEDDVYKKFTPYAKIVSASKWNVGPKADWKVGDIIFLGDAYMNVQSNPLWEAWHEGQKTNQRLLGEEPQKYIRKVFGWVLSGKLYVPDKAGYLLDSKNIVLNAESIKGYSGKWVFMVDEYEIGKLRVKGNPWD